MNKIAIGSNTYEVAEWYGVCSTAATTQAKTVTISGFTSEQLVEGCKVTVRFENGQTSSGFITPTLNVSSTGAKTIYLGNGYADTYEWAGGQILTFVYYNNMWYIEDGIHATTSYWGKTKLTDTISNNSTMALTPKAVYDAGFLTLADLPVWDGSVT